MGDIKKIRRSFGLCAYCGDPMDREGYLCIKCNDLFNGWKHDRVIRLHKELKCANCGQVLDRDGWFCKGCALKLNNHSKIRNAIRRANGLCIQCAAPSDGYYYCQRCRDLKNLRWKKNHS